MSFFQNSHNLVAHGPFIAVHNETQFPKGKCLEALRNASMPQAMHDSSAPNRPGCFPGTREEHIRNITGWGLGHWRAPQARVLWLHGPAGVGKSALAQTCTEHMREKLGASFFFSRPNEWNDPKTFVPTIVYQLATKSEAYRDLVDAVIARDPFVLEKSIDMQFRELLVKPLGELGRHSRKFDENVIIVDGLDECDGQDAQRIIVELVTTSVLQRSTPFLWAFFSRPEPHIVAAFSGAWINEICWQLTLPVSRDADHDIEAYLRDGFRMIRAKYNFPVTIAWPSEDDIHQLVCQSAGLFVYPASAIRFIAHSPGLFGPDQQLKLVLEAGRNNNDHSANPLWYLDQFYILVMKQVPEEILPTTLLFLLVHLHHATGPGGPGSLLAYCAILNFSPMTVYAALNNLHSVIEVDMSQPGHISFYHASFSDFLCDITRSTPQFCVEAQHIYSRFYSACIRVLCHSSATGTNGGEYSIDMLAQWPSSREEMKDQIYSIALWHCFASAGSAELGDDVLQRLSCINWDLVIKFCNEFRYDSDAFVGKIQPNVAGATSPEGSNFTAQKSKNRCPKTIHPSHCTNSDCTNVVRPDPTTQQGGFLTALKRKFDVFRHGSKTSQPAQDEISRITDLVGILTEVLKNKERRKALLGLQDYRAQQMIDYLCFTYIQSGPAAPGFRKLVLHVLCRLSRISMLFPQCYVTKNTIILGEVAASEGFYDVYRGRCGKQSLYLKVMRFLNPSDNKDILWCFHNEAVLWGQLHHPNIVPFYGFHYLGNPSGGPICLVSPWMTNGNLTRYLQAKPLANRKPLIYDVACGLEYIHSEGIVHGDLKGKNIIVNDSGRACITGFTLSTIGNEKILKVTYDVPPGAAPELWNGDPCPSLASDVWAFGMTCYEIMTRQTSFYDRTSDHQVMKWLSEDVLPTRPQGRPELDIDRIDDAMWDLMTSCWARDPENRPTCTQILQRPEFMGLKNEYDDAKDHLVHEKWRHAMLQRAEAFVDLKGVEKILKSL